MKCTSTGFVNTIFDTHTRKRIYMHLHRFANACWFVSSRWCPAVGWLKQKSGAASLPKSTMPETLSTTSTIWQIVRTVFGSKQHGGKKTKWCMKTPWIGRQQWGCQRFQRNIISIWHVSSASETSGISWSFVVTIINVKVHCINMRSVNTYSRGIQCHDKIWQTHVVAAAPFGRCNYVVWNDRGVAFIHFSRPHWKKKWWCDRVTRCLSVTCMFCTFLAPGNQVSTTRTWKIHISAQIAAIW